jgi:hypothetical protein
MSNELVLSPEGRVRWVNLFQGKADMKGVNKKSVALLIPKTASLKLMQDAWEKAAMAEFKGKIPGGLRKLTKGQKPILKDGDEIYESRDDDKQSQYTEYQGCWVLQPSCNETDPLRILDESNSDIMDPADVYDGCYGQVVINFLTYTAKARKQSNGEFFPGGPMCSISLRGFKKTRDGVPIEGGGSAKALSDDDIATFFGGAPAKNQEQDDDL